MLGKRITLFTIADFKIKADFSWIVIALLITWTLATGLFPTYFRNLPTIQYWIMGIIGAIGLFGGIVFHELSHSLVARRFGMPIKEITLWIFGGVAHMEENPPNPRAEFLMAIAGPLSSFLLGFICFGIKELGGNLGGSVLAQGIFWYLFRINLLLGIFNLIPAFPLDGGRALRAGLWRWRNDIIGATRISSYIGSGFAFVLIFLGFLSMFRGGIFGGIWWILIGLFLHSASKNSYKQLLMVKTLSGMPVSRIMKKNPVTVPPGTTLSDLVENYVYTHHYKMFPVVDENGAVQGCVTTENVKSYPRENWEETTVGDITQSCSGENSIPSDMDASKALSLMQRTGKSRLLVVDEGTLAGVVTLKDLLHYLSMKMEMEEEEISNQFKS
jgi:Zn-dependent protease/sulfur carrier protein ThiS